MPPFYLYPFAIVIVERDVSQMFMHSSLVMNIVLIFQVLLPFAIMINVVDNVVWEFVVYRNIPISVPKVFADVKIDREDLF